MEGTFSDIMLYIAYGLAIIALIAAIVLPLISSFSNPQSLVKTGIGLGGIILVFIIAYVVSGDEVTSTYAKFGIDPGLSKTIGGVLITMYIMIGLVTLSIIYTEISKALS